MLDQPLIFDCAGVSLTGILQTPARASCRSTGLIILVGGPQYRIGAHRQYRHLAHAAAAAGFTSLRFDYRGIGDSGGVYPGLPGLDDDILAAVAALRQAVPQVEKIALWGLCEAASAILLHGARIPELAAAVLANPWIEDETIAARSALTHYYGGRALSSGFWRRLLRGRVNIKGSIRGLVTTLRSAMAPRTFQDPEKLSLSRRMATGLAQIKCPLLLVLSGRDATARSFEMALAKDRFWRIANAPNRLVPCPITDADHTFSSAQARDKLALETINFLTSIND